MILDTFFLIDLMNNKSGAVKKIQELNNESQIITAVSIFELCSGLARIQKSETEKQKIMNVLLGQAIFSLDLESAKVGGEIDGVLAKGGEMIDLEDCMIAGMAIVKNQPVLTNDNHFSRIRGLKIVNY
jgi:tRNA(fMet)-specific endonuclease VapC